MIVCSCNRISDSDVNRAIQSLRKDDPDAVLTPGRIYKALGKRAQCGACLPNTIELIVKDIETKE